MIAVQVKRRCGDDAVEGVSAVRELIGAALLANCKRALFVTTAVRFSTEAIRTAQRAEELGLVRSYELLEYEKLAHFLREARVRPNWEVALDPTNGTDWRKSGGIIRDPELTFEDIVAM